MVIIHLLKKIKGLGKYLRAVLKQEQIIMRYKKVFDVIAVLHLEFYPTPNTLRSNISVEPWKEMIYMEVNLIK